VSALAWCSLPLRTPRGILGAMIALFRREITALLLAFAMLAGTVPVASAADHPPSSMASMTMQNGTMSCDQDMPMPVHHMPCNDTQNCLGMLGCAAPVMLPQLASAPFEFLPTQPSWGPERDPSGIALQPALRPPIV
jgi:hypothetical protein